MTQFISLRCNCCEQWIRYEVREEDYDSSCMNHDIAEIELQCGNCDCSYEMVLTRRHDES